MIKNNSVLVHFYIFYIYIHVLLIVDVLFFLELGKREVRFLFYQTNRQAHEVLVVQMN